jgi:hypothetical protein
MFLHPIETRNSLNDILYIFNEPYSDDNNVDDELTEKSVWAAKNEPCRC